jgi:hypothetical protein
MTAHVLRMPTAKQILQYRRGFVRVIDLPYNRQSMTINMTAADSTDLLQKAEGLPGRVPIVHEVAVKAVITPSKRPAGNRQRKFSREWPDEPSPVCRPLGLRRGCAATCPDAPKTAGARREATRSRGRALRDRPADEGPRPYDPADRGPDHPGDIAKRSCAMLVIEAGQV